MNRTFSLTLLVGLLFIISSCGKKELQEQNLALQSELDSISLILDETEKAVLALSEIGELLDTIESSRNMMRFEMEESGIEYGDYVKRVQNLNAYLEQAESRIAELEKSGRSSASLVKKLRTELDEKIRQIDAMESLITDYQADNASMQGTLHLQEAEIEDLEWEIQLAEQELEFLEVRIEEMIELSKMTEADGYYARAVAYEEAANRTKLAPRKKKETLKQALELYRQALNMGHELAQTKVDELSEQVE